MWLDIYFGCDKIMKPYRPIDVSQEEYDKKIELIFKQLNELRENNITFLKVTCGGCGDKTPLYETFRCYYCKIVFCKACASIHFKEEDLKKE